MVRCPQPEKVPLRHKNGAFGANSPSKVAPPRRRGLPGGLFLIVSMLIFVGIGCGNEDEKAIQELVADVARAVEYGDQEFVSGVVAADYSDRFGHDPDAVVSRVFRAVEGQDVQIELGKIDVEINEKSKTATAKFTVDISGAGSLTADAEAVSKNRRMVVHLRRGGRRWVIQRGDVELSLW